MLVSSKAGSSSEARFPRLIAPVTAGTVHAGLELMLTYPLKITDLKKPPSLRQVADRLENRGGQPGARRTRPIPEKKTGL